MPDDTRTTVGDEALDAAQAARRELGDLEIVLADLERDLASTDEPLCNCCTMKAVRIARAKARAVRDWAALA